jgi:hypothetical protein
VGRCVDSLVDRRFASQHCAILGRGRIESNGFAPYEEGNIQDSDLF